MNNSGFVLEFLLKHKLESERMRILITGGAGYIGSVTNAFLREAGHDTLVFDNLSRGNTDFVKGTKLVIGDLTDRQQIAHVFRKNGIDCVMHLASFAHVGESMENPGMYFSNNVVGGINLLDAMKEHGVNRVFVFMLGLRNACQSAGQ